MYLHVAVAESWRRCNSAAAALLVLLPARSQSCRRAVLVHVHQMWAAVVPVWRSASVLLLLRLKKLLFFF